MTNTASKMGKLKTTPAVLSDRTIRRLSLALFAVIAIGLPAIAIFYYADRHVEGGGSIVQRAVAAAEEAVRDEPNKLSNRLALGAAYAAADRDADAAAQYGVVLGVDPQNVSALLGRGDALLSAGQLEGAVQDYQSLVDIVSQTDTASANRQLEAAFYGLGVIALQQNRPSDAAEQLANALLIDRTDADALNLMGTALIALGDMPNAIQALRDAVALVPTGWREPYSQLNQAYTAYGDTEGAAYAAGMIALCDGRTGDANDLLGPLTTGRYARDALIGLALSAEQSGNSATAAELYGRVYASNPQDFAAIVGLTRLGVEVATPAPAAPSPTSQGQ